MKLNRQDYFVILWAGDTETKSPAFAKMKLNRQDYYVILWAGDTETKSPASLRSATDFFHFILLASELAAD
jgi:hypothetical protein